MPNANQRLTQIKGRVIRKEERLEEILSLLSLQGDSCVAWIYSLCVEPCLGQRESQGNVRESACAKGASPIKLSEYWPSSDAV